MTRTFEVKITGPEGAVPFINYFKVQRALQEWLDNHEILWMTKTKVQVKPATTGRT